MRCASSWACRWCGATAADRTSTVAVACSPAAPASYNDGTEQAQEFDVPRLVRAAVLVLGLLAGAAVLWRALVPKAEKAPPCADRVVWLFEPAERGAILASPCLAGGRLYVTAVSDSVFAPRGALYCLDADTGRVRWKFDDDGEMLHGYSSPCVAGGRVYVGEGMHSNLVCRLYCLDADTG